MKEIMEQYGKMVIGIIASILCIGFLRGFVLSAAGPFGKLIVNYIGMYM
ncbi:MAG: hypothetical protein J6N76_07905 [Lachnospiraceae bacterium]|nr:hypothetical protein [Lachnospiraceae bacterium]